MTVEELRDMILEDINGQGQVSYCNGYAILMAEHYHAIMITFEENGDKLFGKISTGIDKDNNVIIKQVSFARNKEDLPN